MMKKMSAVGVAAVMIASQTMAGDAVQWRVEDGGNGHWYEAISHPSIDWNTALATARSIGGDLASIGSTQENQFVFELSTSLWVGGWAGPWIGGFQDRGAPDYLEPSGGWRWSDGSTFSFTAWDCYNPNNQEDREDYLHYAINPACSSVPIPSWNDVYQYSLLGGFVVEWSADCNNDGIVDYGQCHDGTLPDYNGNNVPDCCDRGEACVVGNYPVQWRVEDGGNGHWYQCLRTGGSGEVWNVSRAAANALGGHLATLTSQQENSWVYELSVAQTAWSGRDGPLLGGYKLPDNSFRWVTDEPWSYTSWLPGEPSSGLWEPYLNFLGPQGTSSSGATWNDTDAIIPPDNSGDQTYTYIVEWEADCNNDGIVDYGQIRIGQLADTNNNGVPDTCECIGDIDTDGTINGSDLGIMLAYWGTTSIDPASIACDLNVDGVVNGSDLGILLASWGPCNL